MNEILNDKELIKNLKLGLEEVENEEYTIIVDFKHRQNAYE